MPLARLDDAVEDTKLRKPCPSLFFLFFSPKIYRWVLFSFLPFSSFFFPFFQKGKKGRKRKKLFILFYFFLDLSLGSYDVFRCVWRWEIVPAEQ